MSLPISSVRSFQLGCKFVPLSLCIPIPSSRFLSIVHLESVLLRSVRDDGLLPEKLVAPEHPHVLV
eukprot:542552-Pleurochrysis_carterae.AAC.1